MPCLLSQPSYAQFVVQNALQVILLPHYQILALGMSHPEANLAMNHSGQLDQLEGVHVRFLSVFTAHKTLGHGLNFFYVALTLKISSTNHMKIMQHQMLCMV